MVATSASTAPSSPALARSFTVAASAEGAAEKDALSGAARAALGRTHVRRALRLKTRGCGGRSKPRA